MVMGYWGNGVMENAQTPQFNVSYWVWNANLTQLLYEVKESSDLTDAQWQGIEPLLPLPKPGGRPRTTNLREVISGILYLLRSGCPWRMLPHDFPPWGTVWYYFRRWRIDGIWHRIP